MPAHSATIAPPVVLITGFREGSGGMAGMLGRSGYTVVAASSATAAHERARAVRPDVIVFAGDLPDMSAIDACSLLRSDARIGRNVPILLLTARKPTPDERVTALRAGAWDFLLQPSDSEELRLKLETYVQAKRNIDDALAEGFVDPATGLHSRSGLARRARELGALMSRNHGALACVVFALDAEPMEPGAGRVVTHATRVSDVVGALSPTQVAVLAPATDQAGAVKLAERVGGALREALTRSGPSAAARAVALRVGYDAVANLMYSPIDPVELLARATAAVDKGRPEHGTAWVRRFEKVRGPESAAEQPARISQPGLALEKGRTSP